MGGLGDGPRADGSPGRVIVMGISALVVAAGGAFAARYALGAHMDAERATAAQVRAIDGQVHGGDPRDAGAQPPLPAERGEGRGEGQRPQGGFGDGAPPAAVDLSRHESLVPREARAEGGERVGPFQGFGVAVESVPAGARVLADGVELGQAPLVASVRCQVGATVEVRVEKAGFRPWRRATRCRKDARVELEARLAR